MSNKEELVYLMWLSVRTDFLPSIKNHLRKFSAQQIYSMSTEELIKAGFSPSQVKKLEKKDIGFFEKLERYCEYSGIFSICYTDSQYPQKMLQYPDFPLILYTKGDLALLNYSLKVGFVGTRSTTFEGEEFSKKIALDLIGENAVLVTGGALGTDTVAIDASFEKNVPCIVVLGCDIDKSYPAQNYSRFSYVSSTGLLLSEYPPKTNARFFASRNRIIAALSNQVVIPQAPVGSGAIITAHCASRYGIPVFVRNSDGNSFSGCRELLEEGALAYVNSKETVSFSGVAPTLKKSTAVRENIMFEKESRCESNERLKEYSSGIKKYIAECIVGGRDMPDMMSKGEYCISDILCAVSEMEIEGDIVALPGNRYKLK